LLDSIIDKVLRMFPDFYYPFIIISLFVLVNVFFIKEKKQNNLNARTTTGLIVDAIMLSIVLIFMVTPTWLLVMMTFAPDSMQEGDKIILSAQIMAVTYVIIITLHRYTLLFDRERIQTTMNRVNDLFMLVPALMVTAFVIESSIRQIFGIYPTYAEQILKTGPLIGATFVLFIGYSYIKGAWDGITKLAIRNEKKRAGLHKNETLLWLLGSFGLIIIFTFGAHSYWSMGLNETNNIFSMDNGYGEIIIERNYIINSTYKGIYQIPQIDITVYSPLEFDNKAEYPIVGGIGSSSGLYWLNYSILDKNNRGTVITSEKIPAGEYVQYNLEWWENGKQPSAKFWLNITTSNVKTKELFTIRDNMRDYGDNSCENITVYRNKVAEGTDSTVEIKPGNNYYRLWYTPKAFLRMEFDVKEPENNCFEVICNVAKTR